MVKSARFRDSHLHGEDSVVGEIPRFARLVLGDSQWH